MSHVCFYLLYLLIYFSPLLYLSGVVAPSIITVAVNCAIVANYIIYTLSNYVIVTNYIIYT